MIRISANPPSATAKSDIISKFLSQVRAGHMLNPFPPSKCQGVIIGSYPKEDPWEMESHSRSFIPSGRSVNDNLHKELTHICYTSLDDAVALMHTLGPGTPLA